MRKIFSIVIIFFTVFVFASIFGNSGTSAKVTGQDVRQEVKAQKEVRKASIEAKLTEVRQSRIRNFWTRMKKRLLAMFERIEVLTSRIEARLAKIKAADNSLDLSETEGKLEEAKSLLTETEILIIESDDILEDALESEEPKSAFQDFKDHVSLIKRNLKEVHRLLVSVIGDIKGLRVGQSEETETE